MQGTTWKEGFSMCWRFSCSREATLLFSILDPISDHSSSYLSLRPTGFIVCAWTCGTSIFFRFLAVAAPSARHTLLLISQRLLLSLFRSLQTSPSLKLFPEHSGQNNTSYHSLLYTWFCFLPSICDILTYSIMFYLNILIFHPWIGRGLFFITCYWVSTKYVFLK